MNGRTSTILTALAIAALVAVGVAYLIANPTARDKAKVAVTPSESPIISPLTERPIISAAPVNNVTQEQVAVQGVQTGTSAPTGAAEWMIAGLVGLIGISSWNLVRLQRVR